MLVKSKFKSKICCSLNFAPHYREEIFLNMEKELDCDFFFGNFTYGDIKKIDYSKFRKKIRELVFIRFLNKIYFLKGQTKLSFRDYKFYIITGQSYNISAWALLILNKIRGKRTFIWNHGWYGNESYFTKLLKKVQFKLASGYLLYGTYAKSLMEIHGFDSKKLHVIYNSLSYTKQLKIRKKLKECFIYRNHFKNTYPTLIFIGRLTSGKKLGLIIKSMRLAYHEGFNFNVVLVGEGPQKQQLEKLAKNYNMQKNIWFYGSCYNEEQIGELIYNADLCVSPGNIGLTAIHSLMFGTPAITHNNFSNQMPEFEAIEDNITGSFFEENNAEDLKNSIISWLQNYPKKDKKLVRACYNKIDLYYNPNYQIKILQKILK